MKHPIQPLVTDDGSLRFQSNAIVKFLAAFSRRHGIDMNDLAEMPFDDEDRQQFAQLIGYTLSGYGELPYVDDAAYNRAEGEDNARLITVEPAMLDVATEVARVLRLCLNDDGSWSDMPASYKRSLMEQAESVLATMNNMPRAT